jgi:hypothetical protein
MDKLTALVPDQLNETWNELCLYPKEHNIYDFQKKNNYNISLSAFEIFGKKLNKSLQNSCWELTELSDQ